jgi:hypothetical protein
MSDLFDTALREKYRQYFVNDPLLKDLYHNDTDREGDPIF